jgi:hypothetical protein
MWSIITDELLTSIGFKRERIWSKTQNNFTLKYSIDGFDGTIDFIATFCSPGADSPEEQVENGSSIEYLIENCQSPYHVYGGDFHIVSIDLEAELMLLISCLKIEVQY